MVNEIIIKPSRRLAFSDIGEMWRFRELLYFFTWRDLKIRYKQTAIGILWAIFQPLMTMVVFSIFFGHFGKIPSDGIPYPIFVYVGLLIWQFFSASLSAASNSLAGNAGIITKVYFPRLLLPISSTITNLVDFMVASTVLVGIMIYYHYVPNFLGLLILPILILLSFMISVGTGLILSSINVKYRDIRYVLPFFIQMLLFVTPVIYPPSIAGKYAWILAINPMTSVLEAARAAILKTGHVPWGGLLYTAVAGVIILIFGILSFKKIERSFADII